MRRIGDFCILIPHMKTQSARNIAFCIVIAILAIPGMHIGSVVAGLIAAGLLLGHSANDLNRE